MRMSDQTLVGGQVFLALTDESCVYNLVMGELKMVSKNFMLLYGFCVVLIFVVNVVISVSK